MTADEALRTLYNCAKIKEFLSIPRTGKHNAEVVEAVNTLAYHLGINMRVGVIEENKDDKGRSD